MTKRILHKTLYVFGALFLCLLFVFQTAIFPAKANETKVQDFRRTSILDDLSDMDITLYPALPYGEPQVIRCQEYCYSEKPFFAEYYSLMVYVYNPTEMPLNVKGENTINMAVTYGTDGKPLDYAKVPLTYCTKTENNRFYKFEVSYAGLLTMAINYAKAHDGERRYDFADIEFVSEDGKDVDSSGYSKTYYFNGFSAGCGETADSESTLTCHVEGAETIELNVKHTNYRTEEYNANNVCDELNTAYFSVGENYFEKYGNLQKIQAEWYEYKTKFIFVTSDSDAYDKLEPYIGINIGNGVDDLNIRVEWQEEYDMGDGTMLPMKYSYNGNYDSLTSLGYNVSVIDRMDWLIPCENAKTRDYDISAEEIMKYMGRYTTKFGGETLNGYSANLFTDTVDAGRTRGHNVQTIDANEEYNLLVYDKSQSAWNKFWHGSKFENLGYSPIVTFSEKDLDTVKAMTAEQFGTTYLVNTNDQEDVRDYVITELGKGNRPVLFRFAQTDYYASTVRFDNTNIPFSTDNGYVAQMTQFHDFDVISLTFRSEKGVDTVIGVCATPIDIINGTDAPNGLDDEPDWWFWLVLLGVGLVVVFIVSILWPIIWPAIVGAIKFAVRLLGKAIVGLVKGLWFLLSLPFVLIGKLFQRKDKYDDEDYET